jgi:aerobic-type carbon monoxide dehydrogenase small subunit (CoxS/CutS family)/CO/xanthine dehydrogenase FAD-binding subunit
MTSGAGGVTLSINGEQHRLEVGPEVSLLDALRERLGLTGAKMGCDLGQCGACTVLLDGKRVNSCLVLAVRAEGREITTIEGLGRNGGLHPLQQAFIDHDAFQCGYCTPGQIMSGVALIAEGRIRQHHRGDPPSRGERLTMQPYTLERPGRLADAARLALEGGDFIAGGTDMVQLLKEWVRRPGRLIDLEGLLDDCIAIEGETLRIGAGARMEVVATHPDVARAAPMIAEALLESASPQVRNLATMGGNLLQRTRCGYFRDIGVSACNKRDPGSGCAAIGGENRIHAVLGTSSACIATHPSDLAVVLVALDASLAVIGPNGERRIAAEALYRVWDRQPELETTLHPGEIITAMGPAIRRRRAG